MRYFKLSLVLVALTFGLSACGESHSWRQKTIIEVETPHGLVSGGSVVQVNLRWFGQLEQDLAQGHAVNASSSGEASFVEVMPGKYLFALSVSDPSERTLMTFGGDVDAYGRLKEDTKTISRRIPWLRETRAIPAKFYPMLVTFDDINDPKSVKKVDPANLAASFGSGVSLKSISLEITDEPVTEGKVEAVLGWLAALKGGYLSGEFANDGRYYGLHGGNFRSRQ